MARTTTTSAAALAAVLLLFAGETKAGEVITPPASVDIPRVAEHLQGVSMGDTAAAHADANRDGIIDSADLISAVVVTRITDGEPASPDNEFTVEIAVGQNANSRVPFAGNFRVYFPSEAVTVLSVNQGQMGAIFGSSSDETSTLPGYPDRFRDVATAGNFGSTNPTPTVFSIRFRTRDTLQLPYTIIVTGDPGSSSSLVDVGLRRIPHLYDYSETLEIDGPIIAPTK
jgi:hypothetical protein